MPSLHVSFGARRGTGEELAGRRAALKPPRCLGRGLKWGGLFLLIALLSQEKSWGATVDAFPQIQIFASLNLLFKTGVVCMGGCLLHTS